MKVCRVAVESVYECQSQYSVLLALSALACRQNLRVQITYVRGNEALSTHEDILYQRGVLHCCRN